MLERDSRRNRSIRCSLSRKPASPGTTPAAGRSSSCSACSRPSRLAKSLAYPPGRGQAATSGRTGSTPHFAYVGGGFGGRDHTPFPLYVALAAMFFPDRPVRLAHDRYQQFQAGIKRHAFKMQSTIGIDRATGKITRLRGRPRPRWRRACQLFGQRRRRGGDRRDRHLRRPESRRDHRRRPFARRHRRLDARLRDAADDDGAGGARSTKPRPRCRSIPIEFRRRNALKTGGRTMTGNPYNGLGPHRRRSSTSSSAHPIWTERADAEGAARQRRAGSSAPASPASPRTTAPAPTARSASVEIDRDGRITIHADAVEMGNGIGTALANRVALHLGGVADEVAVAQVDGFDALASSPPVIPTRSTRQTQDAAARNPRWVPADQLCDERVDRRACRHAGRGRGGPRRVPLRPLAGGARALGDRARATRGRGNGTRHTGRTASSPCPDLPPLPLAASPRRRTPAVA